ncbi:MAG: hypothetical protein Q8M70_03405 [bacterium]|jgi:hypothetical protein|nr:hypothetical protein [bacterium]
MSKITIEIDDILLDKLHKSLEIQKESLDEAFSKFVEGYITTAYEKVYKFLDELNAYIYNVDMKVDIKTNSQNRSLSYYVNNDLKGVRRISGWARKPNQMNHKIIRAYFQLEKEYGIVRLRELQLRCTDKANHPEVFVPTFNSNYSQMKFDEGNSHGKIFEEEYGIVTIWEKAKNELEAHRRFFE